jgi:hypothetical protein
MEIDVPPLDAFSAPRLDEGSGPSGILAFTPIAEAALVEVHYGNTTHSIT